MRIGYKNHFIIYIFDDIKIYQIKYCLDAICSNDCLIVSHFLNGKPCFKVDVTFFKDIRVEYFFNELNSWFFLYRIEF